MLNLVSSHSHFTDKFQIQVAGIFPNNKNGKFQLVIGKISMGSSNGKVTLASHIDAINACVAQGAKVISTPMGNECFSQRESNHLNKLYDQGK